MNNTTSTSLTAPSRALQYPETGLITYYINLAKRLTQQYAYPNTPAWLQYEDLMQECLIACYDSSTTYDPNNATGVPFPQYASYKMKYKLLDILRQKTLPQAELTEYLASNTPSTTDCPEKTALRQETKTELYQSLRELPPAEQEVIYKFYYEEKKMKEIASELGLSVGRVSQIHRRGLGLLQSSLSK